MKKWLLCIPLGVLLLLAIYGASQLKSTPTDQQNYDLYFLSDSYASGSALDTESRWTAKRRSSSSWYTPCCPSQSAWT